MNDTRVEASAARYRLSDGSLGTFQQWQKENPCLGADDGEHDFISVDDHVFCNNWDDSLHGCRALPPVPVKVDNILIRSIHKVVSWL